MKAAWKGMFLVVTWILLVGLRPGCSAAVTEDTDVTNSEMDLKTSTRAKTVADLSFVTIPDSETTVQDSLGGATASSTVPPRSDAPSSSSSSSSSSEVVTTPHATTNKDTTPEQLPSVTAVTSTTTESAVRTPSEMATVAMETVSESEEQKTTKVSMETQHSSEMTVLVTTNNSTTVTEDPVTAKVPMTSAEGRQEKRLFLENPGSISFCECDPTGPSLDLSTCVGRRSVSHPQCHCRQVCARQAGESCSPSEDLCDVEFGLHCSSDTLICQGKLLIQKMNVTHNSLTLQWKSTTTEEIPQASVMYTTFYRGSQTHWNEAETKDSSVTIEELRPLTEYFVKVEENGDQEIIVVQTSDNPLSNAPKILITNKTPSSLTLAWDDFKLPNYKSGYVVEYRQQMDDPKEQRDWIQIQADNVPLMTITKLKPVTSYEVRVSVWDDAEEKTMGTYSEVIHAFTDDGCVRMNQTFNVGADFNEGCERRCVCIGRDEGSCRDRCEPPYYRQGARQLDPYCFETPALEDICCVLVRCAEGKSEGLDGLDVEGISYADKPGECPELLENVNSEPESCPTDCHHDQDCAGSTKCCRSSCGGSLCVEPFKGRGLCENVFCGPNAKCEMEDGHPTCQCLHGYSGDPINLSEGCKKEASGRSADTCTYKNSTYKPGETFFDGCELRCICEELEVSCHKRCPFNVQEVAPPDPHCEVIQDSRDPCCKVYACESATDNVTSVANVSIGPSLMTDSTTPSVETTIKEARDEENMMEAPVTHTTASKTEGAVATSTMEEMASEVPSTTTEQNAHNIIHMNEDRKLAHHHAVTTDGYSSTTTTTEPVMMADEGTAPPVDGMGTTDFGETEDMAQDVNDTVNEDIESLKGPVIFFDGCEFNNQTYATWETFYDGCDAKCLCEGKGRISCSPRCAPMSAPFGDVCHEIPDPIDPCCRITVCKAPGDMDKVEDVEGLKVTVESALPQNATTVRVRVMLRPREYPFVTDSSRDIIQVWTAPIRNDSDISWTKQKFLMTELTKVERGIYEVDVYGLAPVTEYFLKVVRQTPGRDEDDFSNTVSVKTFPAAVKTSFKGCFHHNKSYDVGDIFYDGCDYRCVCHENGLLECRERCDVFVDTVGLEHCQWGPAPDDDCCTVPYCDDTPPRTDGNWPRGHPQFTPPDAFCVVGPDHVRRVGDNWETECPKRRCTCVMLRNGTTTVECRNNCPPIPPNFHISTPQCPNPYLVKPSDPCVCPYTICTNAHTVNMPMCQYKGEMYHVGEFYDACRSVCHCDPDLQVNCAAIECPHHFPSHMSGCLEWEEDPNFVPRPPNCCPQTRCKNDGSCMYRGVALANFQVVNVHDEPADCGTVCMCSNGNITCENRCSTLSENPPKHLPCPPQLAFKGHLPGDDCCLHWMCREPAPAGMELQNVHVVSINPTTIRVRLTVPRSVVGKIGHAELHFTTDRSIPLSSWHVQRFTRPKRLFDTANIEYYMSGLRPDTTYFFQVILVVDNMPNIPGSEVLRLRMPSDSTTTEAATSTATSATTMMPTTTTMTTTTTTTTTTLPPVIVMDAVLQASEINTTSVKVSWRSFDPDEKRFIDGIRLRYRMADHSDWLMTPMIHRDVTTYMVRNLQPDTPYVVDMMFSTPEGTSANLMSSKPLEVTTATPPVDMYSFPVTLHQVKTGPYASEISLQGVPEPISKYVHLVMVSYKSDSDPSMAETYKVPKGSAIKLDKLEPGRRYKVWMNLFLTNGKTISTDVIDLMTKPAPPEARTNVELTNNTAEALHSHQAQQEEDSKAYYIALIVVAIVAAVAGLGFIVLLIILLRKQSSAKAPITRSPSESAYDNPTYKTYDGERMEDKNCNQP